MADSDVKEMEIITEQTQAVQTETKEPVKTEIPSREKEYEEKIQSFSIKPIDMARVRLTYYPALSKEEDDQIPFYTFYFKPCAALPNGRMITFIHDQVLTDGPLPYPKIPLVRISAEDTFESCFAHSPMMDVLPVQKAIDTLASTLLSNNSSFGVQSILYPKGSNINVQQLAGGMNLVVS